MVATRVVATCTDCTDTHPLGDRPAVPCTTKCPRCGARSYTTDTHHEEGVKSDAQRIEDCVTGIQGVGPAARTAIVSHFGSWRSFLAADLTELVSIAHVGQGNGQRIIDARPGTDSTDESRAGQQTLSETP